MTRLPKRDGGKRYIYTFILSIQHSVSTRRLEYPTTAPRRSRTKSEHHGHSNAAITHLDGLVRATRDQSRTRLVKRRAEDTLWYGPSAYVSITQHLNIPLPNPNYHSGEYHSSAGTVYQSCNPRTRANHCHLSRVESEPIKRRLSIGLTSREEHSILIHAQRVDNCLVPREVVHKRSLRTFPLFDAANTLVSVDGRRNRFKYSLVTARRGTRKRIFVGSDRERSNGFLVVRQGRHGFACGQIPQPVQSSQCDSFEQLEDTGRT